MEILIITILIVAAVILFLVELFFIPGVSIAGITALACVIFAVFYAFIYVGTAAGFITLGVAAVACTGSLVLFMRSKTLDKLSLKENITSKVDKQAEHSVKTGDTGICVTRVALIGQAEVAGKIVEVRSVDGFLDEKTPIRVIRITDGAILVEKLTNHSTNPSNC